MPCLSQISNTENAEMQKKKKKKEGKSLNIQLLPSLCPDNLNMNYIRYKKYLTIKIHLFVPLKITRISLKLT